MLQQEITWFIQDAVIGMKKSRRLLCAGCVACVKQTNTGFKTMTRNHFCNADLEDQKNIADNSETNAGREIVTIGGRWDWFMNLSKFGPWHCFSVT
jgi:hypothetical protein